MKRKLHSCFYQDNKLRNYLISIINTEDAEDQHDEYNLEQIDNSENSEGDSPNTFTPPEYIRIFLEFESSEQRQSFINDYYPNWINPLEGDHEENPASSDKEDDFKEEDSEEEERDYEFLLAYKHSPILWLKTKPHSIVNFNNDERVIGIHLDTPLYLCLHRIHYDFNLDLIHNSFFRITGENVVVGIMDSGIDQTHPDLSHSVIDVLNVSTEEEGDYNGHGTFIAGVIAGSSVQSEGFYVGVAPGAKLFDIKVFNKNGQAHLSDALLAFDLLADRNDNELPDILLLGFTTGFVSEHMPKENEKDTNIAHDLLNLYCKQLYERNVSIIVPAGNFKYYQGALPSPAHSEYVLTVGSVDDKGEILIFPERELKGPAILESDTEWSVNKPEIFLPGSNIVAPRALYGLTPVQNSIPPAYGSISGTSVSAAIAAGLAALVKQIFPSMSPKQVYEALQKYGRMVKGRNTKIKGIIPNIYAYLKEEGKLFKKPRSLKSALRTSLYSAATSFLILVILYLFFRKFL